MAFNAFREVATQQKWTLNPPEPKFVDAYSQVVLMGKYEDIPIRIERTAAMHQFSTTAFLDPPLPMQVAITNEGLGGAIKNMLGFHDVEVGDAEFDKTFRIISKDPDTIKKLFTPEVKAVVRELYTTSRPLGMRGFHISEASVSISRIYVYQMSVEEVMLDVPLVVQAARVIKAAAAQAYR